MLMRFTLVIAIFAHAILSSNGSAENTGSPTIDLQKKHVPNIDKLRHRIKVPLHMRLLDTIDAPSRECTKHRREANSTSKPRHFWMEMHDVSTRSIATLHLHEVPMAIMPQTTYNFKHPFHPSRIQYSVLANRSHDRTTIISIDKLSGRVRGLHREDGRAKRLADEEGRLHMRALEGVKREKEWPCGVLSRKKEEEDGSFGTGALHENVFGGARAAAGCKQDVDGCNAEPIATTKGWTQPQKYSFHINISIGDLDEFQQLFWTGRS